MRQHLKGESGELYVNESQGIAVPLLKYISPEKSTIAIRESEIKPSLLSHLAFHAGIKKRNEKSLLREEGVQSGTDVFQLCGRCRNSKLKSM
jgi:hypothetical protein